MTAAKVEHKDVMIALLGASAALAGLVLVFLGVVVSAVQSYASDTPTQVFWRYRVLGSVIASAFLVGLLAVGLSAWWLAGGQHKVLYGWSIVTFVVQLCLLAVAAIWVLVTFVWKTP